MTHQDTTSSVTKVQKLQVSAVNQITELLWTLPRYKLKKIGSKTQINCSISELTKKTTLSRKTEQNRLLTKQLNQAQTIPSEKIEPVFILKYTSTFNVESALTSSRTFNSVPASNPTVRESLKALKTTKLSNTTQTLTNKKNRVNNSKDSLDAYNRNMINRLIKLTIQG